MATKTSEWTLRADTRNGRREVGIRVQWDSVSPTWATVYYNVDGGATVVEYGKITIAREGRFGVRHGAWGPVIGAAPIKSVGVVSDGGSNTDGQGKNIRAAVEDWASAVASKAIRA